jgi:UrcA family protein
MNGLLIKEGNMKPRLTFLFVSTAFLALAAIGLVFKTEPAIAQQAAEEVEEIVVEAPFMRDVEARTTTPGGAKIETIQFNRRVSYADLDLSNDVDLIELETRIKTIAKESCEKLDDMFPLVKPSGRQEVRRCTDKAIESAEEQVQVAIVAAK